MIKLVLSYLISLFLFLKIFHIPYLLFDTNLVKSYYSKSSNIITEFFVVYIYLYLGNKYKNIIFTTMILSTLFYIVFTRLLYHKFWTPWFLSGGVKTILYDVLFIYVVNYLNKLI